MKRGGDVAVDFPGLTIIHHNQPERKTAWHTHDNEHQLILVLQGRVLLEAEGERKLVATAGRTLLIPAGCSHAFHSQEAHQGERVLALVQRPLWDDAGGASPCLGVHVTQALVREVLFFLLLHPHTAFAGPFAHAAVVATCEALRLAGHSSPLWPDSGNHKASESFSQHVRSRAPDERVKRALFYLEEQAFEDVPLAKLAKASGLSERNLSRLFLQQTGMTPKQMQTRMRIAKACDLLRSGQRTVTDVAFEVGYGGLSSFFSAFRAVTGKSPSEWRDSEVALARTGKPRPPKAP
jgi:AraC-like DNA-binding protein